MSDPRESEALKPCPWCEGSSLSVETYDVQPDGYHGGYVTCMDCDAQGAGAISLNGWLSTKAEAHAAAIAAWNTRPTSDLEAVKEACAKVAAATRPQPETCGLDVLYGYERARHDIALAIRNLTLTKPGETM